MAAFGMIWALDMLLLYKIFVTFLLSLVGAILSVSWIKLLASYGDLNSSKMKIISYMEKQLPASLYDAEWAALSDKLNKRKYVSFTDSEKRVPALFIFSIYFSIDFSLIKTPYKIRGFERDKEYYHVQGGKSFRLSQPQQMMAQEREIVDEAYAGDIIGVFDPGIFSIGDTITTAGKKFRYSGIPTFAPEHFARVSAKDSMKRKQFVKGTEQIAQEGAIQIFKVPYSGMEEVIVGVVGTLQFEVFQYRMKNEYGVDLRMEGLPYEEIRLIDSYPGDLSDLNLGSDAELLEDYRGRSLLVFSSYWAIDFTVKRNPGLVLKEIVVQEG